MLGALGPRNRLLSDLREIFGNSLSILTGRLLDLPTRFLFLYSFSGRTLLMGWGWNQSVRSLYLRGLLGP